MKPEIVKAIEAKAKMQEKIRIAAYSAVEEFRAATGLSPSDITIYMAESSLLSGPSHYVVGEVMSTVELGR